MSLTTFTAPLGILTAFSAPGVASVVGILDESGSPVLDELGTAILEEGPGIPPGLGLLDETFGGSVLDESGAFILDESGS